MSSLAGAAFAQDATSSIEQSRLYQQSQSSISGNVAPNAGGLSLGQSTPSDDESFGAQQILKTEPKVPQFYIGADVATYYTSNAALTRHDTVSDGFVVTDAALAWVPQVSREMQMQLGVRVSLFRYFNISSLDFENITPGVGVLWTPSWGRGVAFAARYDFTELLDRHSTELLQDHEFSLALQKVFPLSRAQAFSAGLIGSVGISDPHSQQRDQVGFGVGYHLQITRKLTADVGYRHAWYFYNSGDRTDLNQVASVGVHYFVTPWATIDGFISGATNYSNRSVFKYNVFSTGGGISVTVRF